MRTEKALDLLIGFGLLHKLKQRCLPFPSQLLECFERKGVNDIDEQNGYHCVA
jgi:hypothetical protein